MSSSLRQFDRVEDRIRLHRQVSNSPILIVEGPDDRLVLREHFPGVDLFPAGGRVNVLNAIEVLSGWGAVDIVGVIDKDFDDSTDLAKFGDRLFPYECRDLEGMLISLGVLALVIEHQGSAAKIANLGGMDALVLRLLEVVEPISALRSANRAESWGLVFDGIRISEKIDRKTLEFRYEGYVAALVQKSGSAIGRKQIETGVVGHPKDDLGPRGRDVIEVAGVALRHLAGSHVSTAVTEDVLTAQIHSSAGLSLSRSEWIRELRERLHALPSVG